MYNIYAKNMRGKFVENISNINSLRRKSVAWDMMIETGIKWMGDLKCFVCNMERLKNCNV